jgi:hypothetical protein
MDPRYAHIVVAYAAKHGYNNILDNTASAIVTSECLSETLPKLPEYLFLPWVISIDYFSLPLGLIYFCAGKIL